MIAKVTNFFTEVVTELKKVSWPTRRDLKDATIIVFIGTAFLGVSIAIIDFVLSKILGIIIGT